jgi:DnaK suppressor protein
MASSEFREQLMRLRDELAAAEEGGEEATKPVELDQTRVGRLSRMDAIQAQAMSVEVQRRREQQLKLIDAALHRIEEGVFGLCAECGEEINPRRLEIDPTTRLCIDCATKAET